MLKKLFIISLLCIYHHTSYAVDSGLYIGVQGGCGNLYRRLSRISDPVSDKYSGLFALATNPLEVENLLGIGFIQYQPSINLGLKITPLLKFNEYKTIADKYTIQYKQIYVRDIMGTLKLFNLAKNVACYGQIGGWNAHAVGLLKELPQNQVDSDPSLELEETLSSETKPETTQKRRKQRPMGGLGLVLGGGVTWQFSKNFLFDFSYKRLLSFRPLLKSKMDHTQIVTLGLSYHVL